ncbi:MAG TPA: hypothetical protein VF077_13300 [Nitrospiraceae bacterium]
MIDQRAWGVWLRTLHNLIRTLGGTSIQDLSDTSLTAAQLEDLTDGGDTALHFHSSDRDRANHTGTQLASTISDFNEELVRNPFLALIAAGA